MSEYIDANLAVIAQRWPGLMASLSQASPLPLEEVQLAEGLDSTLLVKGIQLTSRHDRTREARTQADNLAADAPRAHLYGTGLGDLQQVLLARTALERLDVYILNESLFLLVLQLLDQRQWLADPRVVLHQAADSPEIQLPFLVNPAELVLVSDANAKIRDRLISELDQPFNNRRFLADAPARLARIEANSPFFAKDQDVRVLFGTAPGREVLVVATGPSLERHYGYLRQRRQQQDGPLLIAVDTALKPLQANGIRPDLVVTLDYGITEAELPCQDSAGIGLVYFPTTNSELLAAWQGPRYLAFTTSPFFERLRRELDRGLLNNAGSVIHPALDLAVQMGGKEVVLFGADFAFPGDKSHAGWQNGELGLAPGQSVEWTLDGYGNRVKTLRNFRSYLCGVERYIAKHPQVAFYNSSKAGALIQGAHFHPELVTS
ncbi:DUF115 domain-containing protein [Gallaecimonas kandeliae]|uniref:motility associated factor glycosyltransferase family protein n=1 Tax=Gallaecimonas kandeliae TaxID=3029055 RepID=UPI00264A2F11|nr:6-hydroxymethylpterin diphosphokinase MptE-like protein [Gallaecimonas kandeliae]WKE66726.1 DUF115 domain-containing protein [Gallaecimonas kandeliae]